MQKHAAGAQREYFNIYRPIHSVSTHTIHRRHHLLLQLLQRYVSTVPFVRINDVFF